MYFIYMTLKATWSNNYFWAHIFFLFSWILISILVLTVNSKMSRCVGRTLLVDSAMHKHCPSNAAFFGKQNAKINWKNLSSIQIKSCIFLFKNQSGIRTTVKWNHTIFEKINKCGHQISIILILNHFSELKMLFCWTLKHQF